MQQKGSVQWKETRNIAMQKEGVETRRPSTTARRSASGTLRKKSNLTKKTRLGAMGIQKTTLRCSARPQQVIALEEDATTGATKGIENDVSGGTLLHGVYSDA